MFQINFHNEYDFCSKQFIFVRLQRSPVTSTTANSCFLLHSCDSASQTMMSQEQMSLDSRRSPCRGQKGATGAEAGPGHQADEKLRSEAAPRQPRCQLWPRARLDARELQGVLRTPVRRRPRRILEDLEQGRENQFQRPAVRLQARA